VTIERAQDWGWRGPRPADVVEVPDDAAAAKIVAESRLSGAQAPTIGLLGGDLRRTLGRDDTADHLGAEVALFTVDLVVVELDGTPRVFVSHLVARRHWWRGELLAVMNAEFRRCWDVAPRSHPNDGRVDILHVVDLPPGERYKAWRRLPSGTHLPHPKIETERVASTTLRLRRPMTIELDGVSVGVATEVAIRVQPDALTVCI
jgi:YegS C-terminal NAD kinase beta sandwich-like domain